MWLQSALPRLASVGCGGAKSRYGKSRFEVPHLARGGRRHRRIAVDGFRSFVLAEGGFWVQRNQPAGILHIDSRSAVRDYPRLRHTTTPRHHGRSDDDLKKRMRHREQD